MFVIQIAVLIYRKPWDLKCDLTSDRVYSGNFLQKYSRRYVFYLFLTNWKAQNTESLIIVVSPHSSALYSSADDLVLGKFFV